MLRATGCSWNRSAACLVFELMQMLRSSLISFATTLLWSYAVAILTLIMSLSRFRADPCGADCSGRSGETREPRSLPWYRDLAVHDEALDSEHGRR